MSKPIDDWELSAFVDGELPTRRMAEIEAEAAQSPELRQRLSEMLADHLALATLAHNGAEAENELPPHLAALADELAVEFDTRRTHRADRRRRLLTQMWRQAAAVVLGLSAGWAAASWATSKHDVLREFVDEVTEVHRVTGFAPNFSREASPTVIDNLGSMFAHKLAPPDLADTGFALVGVDVAATDTGPAAVFAYTDPEARRLSLVLSLDTPLLEAFDVEHVAPRVTTHDGLSVSFGQEKGIVYAVVGAIPELRARRIAEQVAESLGH